MKVCRNCGQSKDESEFHRQQESRDGFRASCKACSKSMKQGEIKSKPRGTIAPEGFKFCFRCKTTKKRDEFYNDAHRADGLQVYCKGCLTDFRRAKGAVERKVSRSENGRKLCLKCNEWKPIVSFSPSERGIDGYRPNCKSCVAKDTVNRVNDDIEYYFRRRVNEKKVKGETVGITSKDLVEQFNKQGGRCFYTDEDMVWGWHGQGVNFDKNVSIDRIIPERGYVKGNVVLCTVKANLSKGKWSLTELEKWFPVWYNRIQEFLSEGE